MAVSFVIRQRVRTIKGNRMEDVFSCSGEGERTARMCYQECVETYPSEYFELLKINHQEERLEFTAFK